MTIDVPTMCPIDHPIMYQKNVLPASVPGLLPATTAKPAEAINNATMMLILVTCTLWSVHDQNNITRMFVAPHLLKKIEVPLASRSHAPGRPKPCFPCLKRIQNATHLHPFGTSFWPTRSMVQGAWRSLFEICRSFCLKD